MKQKLDRIIELLEKLLEKNSNGIIMYNPPATLPNPNLHYHGTIPCYNNPCYWAGSGTTGTL